MSASLLEQAIVSHRFVQGMAPDHLRILAECAMFAQFDTGQIVFHAGEIANRFYLIQRGRVSLEAETSERGVITVQTLGAGDVLGWSWLFPPYYWHFKACALEPTQAIFFYGTRLRERCEADKQFGYEIMRRVTAVAMQRLRVTLKETLRLAGAREH